MEQEAPVEAYIDAYVERAEPAKGSEKESKDGDNAEKAAAAAGVGKVASKMPGVQSIRNDEIDPNAKAGGGGDARPSLSLAPASANEQTASCEFLVREDEDNTETKKKKPSSVYDSGKTKKLEDKLREAGAEDAQTQSSIAPDLRQKIVNQASATALDVENQQGRSNREEVEIPAAVDGQNGAIYKKAAYAGGGFDGDTSDKFTPMATPIEAKLAIEDMYDDEELAKKRGETIAVVEATPDDDSWFGKLLRNRMVQALLFVLVLGLIAALVVAFTIGGGKPGDPAPAADNEGAVEPLYYQIGETLDGDVSSQFGLSISTNFDGSRVAIADHDKVQVLEIVQVEADGDGQEDNQDGGNAATLKTTTTYETVLLGPPIQDVTEDGNAAATQDVAASLPFRSPLITKMSSSGQFVAVGWPLYDDVNSGLSHVGKVQVYQLNRSQQDNSYSWQQVGNTLIGVLEENGYFGASLSLSEDGGILAVGAPGVPGEAGGGYAQVFYLNKGLWEPRGSSVSGSDLDLSVYSVSLSGDGSSIALGGIPTVEGGAVAKVFKWYAGDWAEQGTGIGETIGDTSYLAELSADGATVVVSNYYITDADSNTGMGLDVRAFRWMENLQDWQQFGSNMHANYESEKSGYFITLSRDGHRIGMGDPGRRNGSAGSAGHAHIWEFNGAEWVQIGENIWGEAAGDQFGYSVSISGDGERLAVSAPYNRGKGQERGRVIVYEVNEDLWNAAA